MRQNPFFDAGCDPRSKLQCRQDMLGERTDPDFLHRPDKYDNDFIWDGETMDEDKT